MRRILICLLVVTVIASQALGVPPPQLSGAVSWVYDGDTLELENLGKVRLLGIDSPEHKDSPRDTYYLRQGVTRKTLRRVAEEAKRYLIGTVKGQRLTLQLDGDERDRHGRLLVYAYLPDGHLLNRVLLEKGLAAVYRKFDFTLKGDFLAAESAARKGRAGLWAD